MLLANKERELIAAWKQGDEKTIEKIYIDELKNVYPKIYKTLLVDRNNDWLPKIEALLKTSEKEFVLVGIVHLVGEDGILKEMKKRGYTVEIFYGK